MVRGRVLELVAAHVLVLSSGIRILVVAGEGSLIRRYASGKRALVEVRRTLAERHTLTGLPNTRAFEAAITRWPEAMVRKLGYERSPFGTPRDVLLATVRSAQSARRQPTAAA